MIPPFSDYFYPFLLIVKKNKEIKLSSVASGIAAHFNLTGDDVKVRTQGGRTTKHESRVNYCASYLKKMGLVTSSGYGVYNITNQGIDVLNKFGRKLSFSDLKTLPGYINVIASRNKGKDVVLIEAHTRNGSFVPPYFISKDKIGKDKGCKK